MWPWRNNSLTPFPLLSPSPIELHKPQTTISRTCYVCMRAWIVQSRRPTPNAVISVYSPHSENRWHPNVAIHNHQNLNRSPTHTQHTQHDTNHSVCAVHRNPNISAKTYQHYVQDKQLTTRMCLSVGSGERWNRETWQRGTRRRVVRYQT